MPQAIRAGMDCQTFWRSNPKRLKQFCDARGYAEDLDLKAWATGYYVALAFAGKLPAKPELFVDSEAEPVDEAEIMAKQFEAWASLNNQRFKEVKTDE